MSRAAVALVANAILSTTPIQAAPGAPDPTTVEFVYETCKDEAAANAARFCLGYILGVGQIMAVNAQGGDSFAICADPRGSVPSAGAMIQAFLNWAEKHPESMSLRNVFGVALALREAWPCAPRESVDSGPLRDLR